MSTNKNYVKIQFCDQGNTMTAEEFKKSGYTILRNIVEPTEVTRLYEYTLKNLELGNKDDGQVPGSPSFYQDKEVAALQKKLLPAIEKAIQVNLTSVFCYNRIYRTGAVLRAHKDSPRAEISATINLGQKGAPWDLWLVDYDENTQKITLGPGDALIYYGNKLQHWRGKLVDADLVSQIMFHFIDRDGKNNFSAKMEIFRRIRKRCRELMGIAY
jgi:hypothetical protein